MDHLKHTHHFLAGLQILEPPFPSIPSPGLSPVAVHLPYQSHHTGSAQLPKVKSDVAPITSPAPG